MLKENKKYSASSPFNTAANVMVELYYVLSVKTMSFQNKCMQKTGQYQLCLCLPLNVMKKETPFIEINFVKAHNIENHFESYWTICIFRGSACLLTRGAMMH